MDEFGYTRPDERRAHQRVGGAVDHQLRMPR